MIEQTKARTMRTSHSTQASPERHPALDPAALSALAQGRHGDPFALLGPHPCEMGVVVRIFLPGADAVRLLTRDEQTVLAECVRHDDGLFTATLAQRQAYLLDIAWPGGRQLTEDPYAFGPILGELDLHLIAEGRHRDLSRCLGAHATALEGVQGVRFAVWAPNAARVSVVGDFNTWDGRRHPMRLRHGTGIWELFIPRIGPGTLYKYEILGANGQVLPLKADPVALQSELAPGTASVVADPHPFRWTDDRWMRERAARHKADAPISVYEVHAGSWLRHHDGRSFDWAELADRLIPYAVEMGFTHLELLPIMEHPFGGSWGYQPLGQFAPTARFGDPRDFARFVDRCHCAGLGVILDWVPAHFPSDAHGLAQFDGTALYEYQDPREGFHRDWNTLIYNLGRHEVRGFMIASALHWLEHYHVDGLRVDAVASMLYRDYSRNHGEWIPNVYGGRENLEAIAFLREMNEIIAERCPGTITIAEESTAWPGVTQPVEHGGLGFTFKWNMGWMHDTLQYMSLDPIYRRYNHHQLTFGLIYAFSEKFMLPLSHDEVVHGKGTLLGRMPGDRWQKFANLRAYFGFMWSHPGKKLLFMGGELGQEREWNHDAQVEWQALDDPLHRGVQHALRDLNELYRTEPALHRFDTRSEGFQWLVGDDQDNSVFAYLRRAGDECAEVLVVCNMTPVVRESYRIGVPSCAAGTRWHERFNSDSGIYGGSNVGNAGGVHVEDIAAHGHTQSVALALPPLSTLILVRARES